MRADTKTVAIHAKPEKVVEFLREPRNLPRWAIGFAKAVREDSTGWLVMTAGGEMRIRIVTDDKTGVVDYHMSPAPGIEGVAASRVLPNGTGTEYIFTQFQAPDMSDEMFNRSILALAQELTVLKALLEVECPL